MYWGKIEKSLALESDVGYRHVHLMYVRITTRTRIQVRAET